MGKLYVAYGSNLCKNQMRQRCPGAKALGSFELQRAKLVFRNVADLEFDPNYKVPCALWQINKQDEAVLDKYEGVAAGRYFKSEELVIQYMGKPRRVLIYLMRSEAIYPPSQRYADIIRRGYKDFELDESFLDDAIRRSYDEKAPDQEMRLRRIRQRATQEHRALVAEPSESAIKRMEAEAEASALLREIS